MKLKKLAVLAVLGLVFLAENAHAAAKPEDALTTRPEDSVYAVLKLQDTSRFLKWVYSEENMRILRQMAVKGGSFELEARGYLEFLRLLVSMAPIRSAAVAAGITKNDAKSMNMFMQAALTFSPEVRTSVLRIEAGLADTSDAAKLLVGDNIAAHLAETMIKLVKEKDNIYRLNNNIFMAAANDTVLLGSSVNEVRKALKSMNDKDTRLLSKKARKFTAKDFALVHIDYDTVAAFDDRVKSGDLGPRKYFAKPLEMEYAFTRLTDKFIMSIGCNFMEAFTKKYADKLAAQAAKWEDVKGGHIDLDIGGSASPLAAIGTYIDFDALSDIDERKGIIEPILRNMRVRFKVSNDETKALISGPFSLAVNGTVTYGGFKIPALYVSQQGKKGAAANVYSKFTQSQHFSKVKDRILQLDSSISPISCLVADKGEKLGVYLAELASLEQKPVLKPALADLMNRESNASGWIDFEGIQSWLLDENNSFMTMTAPMMITMAAPMKAGNYEKYYKALQDVLTAELSVPSIAIWAKAPEIIHMEFAVKEINPENGLLMRIMKAYQGLNAPADDKKDSQEESKADTENRKEKSE